MKSRILDLLESLAFLFVLVSLVVNRGDVCYELFTPLMHIRTDIVD